MYELDIEREKVVPKNLIWTWCPNCMIHQYHTKNGKAWECQACHKPNPVAKIREEDDDA